jgi:putative NADH-flavin reductase
LKVVLYGATGKAGSVIFKELLDRGHTVVAAARTPEKVQRLKNVTAVQDDLSNPAKTASIVRGTDAVVSAYGPPPDDPSQIIGATDRLVKGIKNQRRRLEASIRIADNSNQSHRPRHFCV